MNCGVYICVLLATLSSMCLGHPPKRWQGEVMPASPQVNDGPPEHARETRSAPLDDQLKPVSRTEEGEGSRDKISELLVKLLSRKAPLRRNSTANSRASGPSASHRIKDRDYLGWMDFGRRSAEEYDYSS